MAKMRVLELDLMNVVAGTRFRGDFEERMNNIIKDIEEMARSSSLSMSFIQLWVQEVGLIRPWMQPIS